ncbi:D-alanyl-D-alanine carboxypeptidase/D-alanyl-D-alanine-endopeptidase [Algivirga pacifica]|uniref:D-alanyl-D-alanine carboxypeptidase/D-alanyl-D-alanine-endopeptidase n=1 Tax=Algivirga pacifica TaxID=1162670 RepID=A0ABP9D5J1_9BACT
MKKNYLAFFTLLAFLLLAGCKQQQLVKQIHRTVTDSEKELQYLAGLAVYDPAKGEMIYDYHADRYFTPASNTKIYTFYTSLRILGDSIKGLEYTVRNDSLFFWGTADPSLLNPNMEQEQDRVLEFLKNRTETLVFLDKPYYEGAFGPGWAWDDYNDYYSAERSAFPIYGNVITVSKQPEEELFNLSPMAFVDSLLVIPDSSYTSVRRDLKSNIFTLRYGQNADMNEQIPFIHSSELNIQLLEDTLNREIPIQPYDPVFVNEQERYFVNSVSTDSLLKVMMQTSDNFMAEQLLLMCHNELTDEFSSRKMIRHALDSLLPELPDTPRWVDGSGLSRYNLFTPRNTVHVFNRLYHSIPQDRLFNMLAASGESGTLSRFYKAESPYIYGKTGTLSNNHSLSGYLITKSGKILIFSYMHNHYMSSSSRIKEKMEAVLKELRDLY